jgi:hypothetical protein
MLNLESKEIGLTNFFWARILNLESKEVGLKKFFLSLESLVLNPKRLGWGFFFLWGVRVDGWFLYEKSFDLSYFFWAMNLVSWILRVWFEHVFSEPWILNLECWTQRGWIEKQIFWARILNLESKEVGLNKSFLSLES